MILNEVHRGKKYKERCENEIKELKKATPAKSRREDKDNNKKSYFTNMQR